MTSTAPAAVEASIDYLIPTSRINRRFWAPGAEYNTGTYQPYPATIRNARLAERPLTLEEHGFTLASFPTQVTDWVEAAANGSAYGQEVCAAAKALTGANLVIPMAGQHRSSGTTGNTIQPPAAEAHVDFTTFTANKIAERMYQAARPNGPGYDRFICFSLWRALSPGPQDYPLALCDYRSVRDEDGTHNTKVDVDVIPTGDALFADIPGEEEMTAATIFYHSPDHRWWYYPDMTLDEVIFIKFHDSDHSQAWRAPHTAFKDTSRPDAVERHSMEYRAVAFFEKEPA